MKLQALSRFVMAPLMTCVVGSGCLLSFSLDSGDDDAPTTRKVDKIKSAKSVALVGVCSYPAMGAGKGAVMERIDVEHSVAHGIARGFEDAFAANFSSATVMTLTQVATMPNVPRGLETPRALCPDGLHPFRKNTGGILATDRPNADEATMKAMAEALQVDAVVAVLAHPGLTFDSLDDPHTAVEMSSGGMHKSLLVVVARNGELLFADEIGAAAERPDAAAAPDLEEAFGGALAMSAIKAMTQK